VPAGEAEGLCGGEAEGGGSARKTTGSGLVPRERIGRREKERWMGINLGERRRKNNRSKV
jgi:hypothetical protein